MSRTLRSVARRGPRISLRTQLLALLLTLLVLPWLGYRYLNEIESFLRQHKEQTMLATAGAVARVLHDQPTLFRHAGTPIGRAERGDHLYARALDAPIHLDGYSEDWAEYADRARRYRAPAPATSTWFDLIAGTRDQYLYVLLNVNDERVVYAEPGADTPSDRVLLAVQTPAGEFRRYTLSSTSPGWVGAQPVPTDADQAPPALERAIRAEWQESGTGYTVELRLPLWLLGTRLSVAVVDVDDPVGRAIHATVATSAMEHVEQLGTITVANAAIDRLLRGLERQQGRVWIVDDQQRVLAMAGKLDALPQDATAPERGLLHGLYRLLLHQPPRDFRDDLSDVSRLRSPEVNAALQGKPSTRWRRTAGDGATIVSAAYPIWDDARVIGAAVAEETSRDILLLQNRALERLLNFSLLAFGLAAVLLLALASSLARRIRRLRDQAERAIASDGRVVGEIAPSPAGDEIGDLSRSFADLLGRLRGYTQYLETMAGKLSHELRTPLAVVRSSLDNLDLAGIEASQQVYTERARSGLDRLEGIVHRMSEATRLEQAFQHAEQEWFDLSELVTACVDGYGSAHPGTEFRWQRPPHRLEVWGVPELLAQLLDKLVSNAADFAQPGTAVDIRLEGVDPVRLEVRNQGPPLPADMEDSLFDSMVSVRTDRSREPHLGLGLYIVRLIAQYHGGRVGAHNNQAPQGATFYVELPGRRKAPAAQSRVQLNGHIPADTK